MVENEWLPHALSIGISYNDFWHMNPHIINLIVRGHNKHLQIMDAMMYTWFGNYAFSAVSVAVEHVLMGRKAKSKYIEKPVLKALEEQKAEQEEKGIELTEEEKKRQTEQLFMRLKIMGANFELSKKAEVNQKHEH